VTLVAGHGSVLNPKPRSSHSQTWDDSNKCGSSHPYSNASRSGEYCGLGCLGDSCLYYQIGCFQGCGSCSLQGKTLYPLPEDLVLAGCQTPPEPTLGGGNKTLEHELRTYNIDGDSWKGDWTKWMPWRSPGSSGKGNTQFQPCGVNSGALASQPEPPTTATDVPNGGNGTSLPELPRSEWAVWKAGSVVEAEWAIYANHGGGYSYRLCKKVPGVVETEECYQKMPLEFATSETEIRYKDGSQAPFKITSPTTSVGTWPVGSQWRKNPVPMCNCDIGIGCGAKAAEAVVAAVFAPKADGKVCVADPTCSFAVPTELPGCKLCANDTALPWSCATCCDGCTPEKVDGGMYCNCKNPGPTPAPGPSPRNHYYDAYPHTHFRPGQTSEICPTGVQYPTLWDQGAGATAGDFGEFQFTMVDKLQIPAGLPAGDYSVSWRWDCEETPQVWNSCSDVIITA